MLPIACLGIAYERLQDLPSALKAYDAGIPLLDRLAVSRTTPQGKAKSDLFVKYRELWRWAERIFRGAVIVSAKLRYGTLAYFWSITSLLTEPIADQSDLRQKPCVIFGCTRCTRRTGLRRFVRCAVA